MSDTQYWRFCACIPAALIAVVAAYSAGAGCYAITMNCLSIVEPFDGPTRALFFAAKLAPFAGPAYAPILLAAWLGARRLGAERTGGLLYLAPAAYTLLLHAALVLFAFTVLPERRLAPTPAFDVATLALGYACVGLAALGWRWLRKRRARARRWSRGYDSRRRASSRS